jgi:ribosome recycling factor
MANHIENAKPDFQKALDRLDNDLKGLRSGRANAALVEDIRVEAYGSTMELKSVAAISIPDAKTIQIEPWDKGLVKDVEKALIGANLGMTPNTAGTVIRLNLPQMTEETRKETVKAVRQKGEQAKIAIRNVRETVRETLAKDEKAHVISEDEKFRLQEQLDKVVKEYNEKIDRLIAEKEEEVMAI